MPTGCDTSNCSSRPRRSWTAVRARIEDGRRANAGSLFATHANSGRKKRYTVGWNESSGMNRHRAVTQAIPARRLVKEPRVHWSSLPRPPRHECTGLVPLRGTASTKDLYYRPKCYYLLSLTTEPRIESRLIGPSRRLSIETGTLSPNTNQSSGPNHLLIQASLRPPGPR